MAHNCPAMDSRHLKDMRRMLRKLLPGLPDGEAVSEDDLLRLAFIDPMTGLPNRRWVSDYMRQLRAAGATGAVALIDLDHFKTLNDRFGHPAGDTLLREFGQRLLALLPREAILARFGGDEYLLVMPDADTGRLNNMLKTCRTKLRHPIPIGESDAVPVTFSAGITLLSGIPLDDVLRTADVAMYAAKERGRAQSVVFDRNLAGFVNRRRELAAAVAALQQQNLALREENRTDSLTGLLNRRALDEVLERPIGDAAGNGVATVFIDIDHFGQINHLHGDDRGDEVLQTVAHSIRAQARAHDLVFRKGGEEFVAILFDIDRDSARLWSERMRAAVVGMGIPNAGSPTASMLTITLGVAHGSRDTPLRQLLRSAALQAMSAKVAGRRNEVHMAPA